MPFQATITASAALKVTPHRKTNSYFHSETIKSCQFVSCACFGLWEEVVENLGRIHIDAAGTGRGVRTRKPFPSTLVPRTCRHWRRNANRARHQPSCRLTAFSPCFSSALARPITSLYNLPSPLSITTFCLRAVSLSPLTSPYNLPFPSLSFSSEFDLDYIWPEARKKIKRC